ncbi:MAG: hypothetical protein HFG67_00925 [Firmicutes bacterium]|nr:hypothetical protein [Bacillota bacterium]
MRFAFTVHRRKIRVEGFGLHRLITECIAKGIVLQNIRFISDIEAVMSISAEDYPRLKKLAKSKYRITVSSEEGWLPFIHGLKMRKAALLGLSLFLIIIYYQSLFVSEIRIYGYEHFTEEEVRTALSDIGFEVGSRKLSTKDEANEVKLHLFRELPGISWVGITYKGTLAEVTIVEGEENPKKETVDAPCDIVADREGYIVEVIPREGIRAVEDGEYVVPGDVIISGAVPYKSTNYAKGDQGELTRYVHASGTVKVHIPYYVEFSILPNVVDSLSGNDIVSAAVYDGESEYDFVKRVSDRKIRQFMKENVGSKAQITNKDLNFNVKENIIEVRVLIETLQEIGIEREIEIQTEINQETFDGSEQSI